MTVEIFVFGSNLAGRHGAGSAKEAVKHYGAKYGVGVGMQGRSYAIPTKDEKLNVLPLDEIEQHVITFCAFADYYKNEKIFNVVAIGCGLAGYKPEQIAPFFKNAPPNVRLPKEFVECLSMQT